MGQRRKSRELALQVLFQKEYVPELPLEQRLSYFKEHFKVDDAVMEYASILAHGVEDNKHEIDKTIGSHSLHWSLSRMSLVDLNILRMAAFEILKGEDVPPKVAINEAIDLAKRFGNLESPAFVNGILDELLKGKS
jgi:N utilization substance protein B